MRRSRSAYHSPARVKKAIGTVALALSLPAHAQFTNYTWTGVFTSNWNYSLSVFPSTLTNWSGNVLPLSANTTRLFFGSSVRKTVNNNFASPFVLNQLTLQ